MAPAEYPVLTLPFDIISQIFVYCLPPEDDASIWRTDAPLLLAGICRDWRDISLATHELWNTMHLSLRPHSVLKVGPLLEFWLPRAGNLPLQLSLVYKSSYGSSSSEDAGLDALSGLISQYAHHWKTIDLVMPFSALFRLPAPKEAFTSLKKVVLNCGEGQQWAGTHAKLFINSPNLKELHIIAGVRPPRLALPWKQLVTLRLDTTSAAECSKVLAYAPNLATVTASLWTVDVRSLAPIPPCSRLESLSLTLSHTRGPALLKALTLPALQHLEVDLDASQEITSFTSLITRSPVFLRRLSVRLGSHLPTHLFRQLFLVLDSLEELEVRKAGVALDTGLLLLKAQRLLLPNLKALRIERTWSNGENAELLADVLESRWRVPANVALPVRLESFWLSSPLTTPPELRSPAVIRLARLRAEGMSIRISSSGYSWFAGRPDAFCTYIL
ncbi:hypothetical protein C8R47DRAFT_585314 [Mycena vitilis]|nr:hypothetical protein C8R47DRAFT_585314 [Mycena vitilis]